MNASLQKVFLITVLSFYGRGKKSR